MHPSVDHPTIDTNSVLLRAYLASALTGLSPTDRALVFKVSDAIASVCRRANIELYEPRKKTDPVHHAHVPDSEVFRLDQQRVSSADLIFYVADFPSTGAGQELTIAGTAMIPIIAVAHESFKVSRMVTGMPGNFTLLRYSSPSDIEFSLGAVLRDMRPSLVRRKEVLSTHEQNRVGAAIRRIRLSRAMSYEDVVAAFRIPNAVTARQIEQCEKAPDFQNNLSLFFLQELAAALDATVADLLH
jgi:hypothetical protein